MPDPFDGKWRFDPANSNLPSPFPRHWTQEISIHDDRLHVREELLSAAGEAAIVELNAKFDGQPYPVSGSPLVDTIAYRRSANTIHGTGSKSGVPSLTETITMDDSADKFALAFHIWRNAQIAASGTAVFVRESVGPSTVPPQ
ncbi:MAG: hypothetical protein HYX27_27855 [Acidobacteria bacterium]|nr:hypothetical protein [Acidobacteriota bacterium]